MRIKEVAKNKEPQYSEDTRSFTNIFYKNLFSSIPRTPEVCTIYMPVLYEEEVWLCVWECGGPEMRAHHLADGTVLSLERKKSERNEGAVAGG